MRDRIDIQEAISLYCLWQNWRLVALRMVRKNGMRFATDAIQAAVRRHDLQDQR